MNVSSALAAAFLAALSLSLPARAAAPGETAGPGPATATCGLDACVDRAVQHAPEVRAEDAAADVARAQKDQARGNYGPRLVLDGGVQVWDSALEINFAIPGVPADLTAMTARDQVTWSVNVTMAQPLAGLWTIFEANQLAALGIDVASLEREAAVRNVALQTTEAWLQASLADALVDIAKASVAARQSDRERAGALVKAGVLVEADLARADLGVTQAKQQQAQAERQVALARARLAQLVGAAVVPASQPAGEPTALPYASLAAAQDKALAERIEVRQLRTRIEQAEGAVELAKAKMAPDVNLVAQAQFAHGSKFSSESAAFVGVTFNWTAWSWGSTYFGIDEARARVRQAREGQRQLEDGLRLEVEAAWVDHQSALDQAALAAEAVKVAQINYELVQKRLGAKAATTFDVVTAETELTQARVNAELARTQARMARARLARATGATATDIAHEARP